MEKGINFLRYTEPRAPSLVFLLAHPRSFQIDLATTTKSAILTFWEDSDMPESVYKIIDLIGTSTESWEKAATAAVDRASHSLRDLRVAEIAELDLVIENGKVTAYRAKVRVSFKYEG